MNQDLVGHKFPYKKSNPHKINPFNSNKTYSTMFSVHKYKRITVDPKIRLLNDPHKVSCAL